MELNKGRLGGGGQESSETRRCLQRQEELRERPGERVEGAKSRAVASFRPWGQGQPHREAARALGQE